MQQIICDYDFCYMNPFMRLFVIFPGQAYSVSLSFRSYCRVRYIAKNDAIFLNRLWEGMRVRAEKKKTNEYVI